MVNIEKRIERLETYEPGIPKETISLLSRLSGWPKDVGPNPSEEEFLEAIRQMRRNMGKRQ